MEILLIIIFGFVFIGLVEYRLKAYRPKGIHGDINYLEYVEKLFGQKREVIRSFIGLTYSGLSILGKYRDYKVEFRQLTTVIQLKIYIEQNDSDEKTIDGFTYSKGCYVRDLKISALMSGKLSNLDLKAILDNALDDLSKDVLLSN